MKIWKNEMLRLIFPVSPPPITPEAGIPWNMMNYKTIKRLSDHYVFALATSQYFSQRNEWYTVTVIVYQNVLIWSQTQEIPFKLIDRQTTYVTKQILDIKRAVWRKVNGGSSSLYNSWFCFVYFVSDASSDN